MNVNLLAVNIGNTRTQVGAFVSGELEAQAEVAHEQLGQLPEAFAAACQALEGAEQAAVYVASVNEQATPQVMRMLHDAGDLQVWRMEQDVPVSIGRKLDPETIVGEDRLLAAAGAYGRLKQACIIVDAGTAVTVDFVDGEGTFHGGAILPGSRMMLRAMHEFTSQLPEIEMSRPDEAIGHNTRQAMLDGVFHGIRGAVRELAEKYAEVYGAYPRIIATGGDAALLFEGYELVENIVPELVLLGMKVTREYELKGGG
jgi:type III pantothenate kinase